MYDKLRCQNRKPFTHKKINNRKIQDKQFVNYDKENKLNENKFNSQKFSWGHFSFFLIIEFHSGSIVKVDPNGKHMVAQSISEFQKLFEESL